MMDFSRIAHVLLALTITTPIAQADQTAAAKQADAFVEARGNYSAAIKKMDLAVADLELSGKWLSELAHCAMNANKAGDIERSEASEAALRKAKAAMYDTLKKQDQVGRSFGKTSPSLQGLACAGGAQDLSQKFAAYKAQTQTSYSTLFESEPGKEAKRVIDLKNAIALARKNLSTSIKAFSTWCNAHSFQCSFAGNACSRNPRQVFPVARAHLNEFERSVLGAEKNPGVRQRLQELVDASAQEQASLEKLSQSCAVASAKQP